MDEMSWDDLSRAREDWPTVAACTEYRWGWWHVVVDAVLLVDDSFKSPSRLKHMRMHTVSTRLVQCLYGQ